MTTSARIRLYRLFLSSRQVLLLSGAALWGCAPGTAGARLAAGGQLPSAELLATSSSVSPTSAPDLCLMPENGGSKNGTRVALAACDNSGPQHWLVATANGSILMGGSTCLDVIDGVNKPGVQLQLWQCYQENTNQKFDISGTVIRWRGTDKCLDLAGGAKIGARLQVATCGPSIATQSWTVKNSSTGTIVDGNMATPGGAGDTGSGAINTAPVDFGSSVLVFDSTMSMDSIQGQMNGVYDRQRGNHFGPERYAYLFKPGAYSLDVKLGFGMTVAGLGSSPDDVTITGSVRSKAEFLPDNNATQNFWRGIENFSVVPTLDNGAMVWAISQGTSMRRVHVRGNLNLSDNGWASGGFVADSKVDGTIDSGTQQQFLSRNDTFGRWQGRNWNMVFVGVDGAPAGEWPATPYSRVDATPVIREKPYLAVDSAGSYVVRFPQLKQLSQGASWMGGSAADVVIPINKFYIAHAGIDSADDINQALGRGLHIILTPGFYQLDKSLQVSYPNTILLGMGIATVRSTQGTAAITVADVDGVTISGITVDAGANNSPSLLVVGQPGANRDHSRNPTMLQDVSCRVGGAGAARATSCITVNSRDVVLDNTWLWRADHGDGAGWDSCPSLNGIIINGSDVTAYALFSEHFQGYQTLWNGERGAAYMYQSEFPYDPPYQSAWQHDGVNGFASYKVSDSVTQHTALGLGMYCVFHNNVRVQNAIEAPNTGGVAPKHLITVWLGVHGDSAIDHIINGSGNAATSSNREQRTSY